MNCEICATKFKRLKDVIRHGTDERHACFFCISCALSLPNVNDVVQHTESKAHFITALATGVRFDAEDRSDFKRASFPPHNCCLLCGSRDGTPNNTHLKTDNHRYMAWLLRSMITSKKIYSNDRLARSNTQAFVCKMINAKRDTPLDDAPSFQKVRSSRFVCESCNLHFVKPEYLNQHLSDESHERMEEFMTKISRIVKRMDIVGAGRDVNVGKTFRGSLRPLYYCEVCCMWIDTSFNYIQHMKSNKHKNAEFVMRQSKKRKVGCDSTRDRVDMEGVVHRRHHSKLETERYGQHSVGELIKSKQCRLKNKNAASDRTGGRVSKKLKTPPSHSNDHYSSVSAKHRREIMKKIKEEEDNFSGQTPETVCEDPSIPGFEVGEIKSHFRRNAVAACQTKRSSSRQLGAGTSETFKKFHPRLEDGEIASNSSRCSVEDRDADVDLDEEHYCELCDFLCYSPLHYDKHLMGEQHKRMRKLINKKVKKAEAKEYEASCNTHPLQYNCELCDAYNHSSQEYEFHLNSATHKKNKWLLYVLK